ncbi:MAG TPA: glycosyl hydrolase, partial [Gammaproteobacteria bacterium]|nr:glycosyl hydrolase [Gammaproteobacteria bacterium]
FTWTMPIVFSPQDPKTLYFASQYLLRSTDAGMNWTAISPDLSRNDKSKQGTSGGPVSQDNASAEFYDLIYSIAPSPLAAGQIWVGTDDGLIHLTRDGGKTWANVTPKGMPEWAKVGIIEASHFDAGTAYAAVDAHKLDDFNPYVFVTRDYGKHWDRIDKGLSAPGYVNVVREDPVQKGLLYVGTELGAFVSLDDGKDWQPLQLNLPTTSVRDLVVKDGDLVAATHGRGFWILDDVSPLRELAAGASPNTDHLYAPRPAVRLHDQSSGNLPYESVGDNPPEGVILYYSLAAKPKQPFTIDITDSTGAVVRSFSSVEKPPKNPLPLEFPNEEEPKPEALEADAGMHQQVWDLRHDSPPAIKGAYTDSGGPVGLLVLPGSYTVTLKVNGKSYSQPLTVTADPRSHVRPEALQQQYGLMVKLDQAVREDHAAANTIVDVRRQLAAIQERFAGDPAAADIVSAAAALDAKLAPVLEPLYQYHAHAEEEQLNYPSDLNSQLSYLEESVDSADSAPTAQQGDMYVTLRGRLDKALADWKALSPDIAALNAEIQKAGYGPVQLAGGG